MSRMPLPEPCAVGKHEPAVLHRTPGDLTVNVCGVCGRHIERQTEAGGPGDPWMTEEQYRDEMRELQAEEDIDEYERPEDRCPPRE